MIFKMVEIHLGQWNDRLLLVQKPQKASPLHCDTRAAVDTENDKIINWQKPKFTFTFSQSLSHSMWFGYLFCPLSSDPSGRMPWMAIGGFVCAKESEKKNKWQYHWWWQFPREWGCFLHFGKYTDTNNCLVKSPIAQPHRYNGFDYRFFELLTESLPVRPHACLPSWLRPFGQRHTVYLLLLHIMDAKRIVVIPMRQIPCILWILRCGSNAWFQMVFFFYTRSSSVNWNSGISLTKKFQLYFRYIYDAFWACKPLNHGKYIYKRPSLNGITGRKGDYRMKREGKKCRKCSCCECLTNIQSFEWKMNGVPHLRA